MPKCTPCISLTLKEEIKKFTEDDPAVVKVLERVPDCPTGKTLNICECERQRGGRAKREPSAYNLFVKDCLSTKDLKGKPFGTAGKFMGECAQEWQRQKPK